MDSNYDSLRDIAVDGERLEPLGALVDDYNESIHEDEEESDKEEKVSWVSEDNLIYHNKDKKSSKWNFIKWTKWLIYDN